MKAIRQYILWLARILGGLAVAFFGIFVLGEGIADLQDARDFQLRSMLLLLAFASFAYFFSLWKPKEGGIAMAIAGAVMGLNMFYHGGIGDVEAALIYALPFLVPGVMFWWSGSGE
jgi:Na+/glutamate symporter